MCQSLNFKTKTLSKIIAAEQKYEYGRENKLTWQEFEYLLIIL